MDNLLDEKKEALEVAGEYLEKLIPGLEPFAVNLRGIGSRILTSSRSSVLMG